MLVKANTGRVVYCSDMGGRRYSFYAPQVWMRQRRILMPTAAIVGTHLSNAAEIAGICIFKRPWHYALGYLCRLALRILPTPTANRKYNPT